MKILEICLFSAGICGVWQRVKQEAIELSNLGHEVNIYSSNLEKGTNKEIALEDSLQKIRIKRYHSRKLGGESFINFSFENEALKFSPELIIVHNYRHLHTTKALKIRNKLIRSGKKCKVFLVTHAPFIEGNKTRSFLSKIAVLIYDNLVGPRTINLFDKIITISNWEVSYLENLGVKKEKLYYLPNGIPEEFFKMKLGLTKNKKILFFGRISPIKNIEVLINAVSMTHAKLNIVGPSEEDYLKTLKELVSNLGLEKRVNFIGPVYNLKEKIKLIDSHKIFVLPSKKEGQPQSLIEAMARGKIVIGSNIPAIRDIITNNKNGFIFNNKEELAKIINNSVESSLKEIKNNSIKTAKIFRMSNISKRLNELIKQTI